MRIEIETHTDYEYTFIMECIYDENDEIVRVECIGWYAGEPNDEDTEYYKYTSPISLWGRAK